MAAEQRTGDEAVQAAPVQSMSDRRSAESCCLELRGGDDAALARSAGRDATVGPARTCSRGFRLCGRRRLPDSIAAGGRIRADALVRGAGTRR
ncbi:MAG TPA: hypothetical protein PKD63_13045 [Solirubrobacteraceae bacterium]|nr:hypothetical protein [Solirubrobacteraceae bacterium]